jgi:hypothetical protein
MLSVNNREIASPDLRGQRRIERCITNSGVAVFIIALSLMLIRYASSMLAIFGLEALWYCMAK